MSELTLCNWCSLRLYKKKYGQENVSVERLSTGDLAGWLAVRVVGREKPVSWFLELSDGCVC